MATARGLVDACPGDPATPARWWLAAGIALAVHACLLFGWRWNEPRALPLAGAYETGVEIDLTDMSAAMSVPEFVHVPDSWPEAAEPVAEPPVNPAAEEIPQEPLPEELAPAEPARPEPARPAPVRPRIRAEAAKPARQEPGGEPGKAQAEEDRLEAAVSRLQAADLPPSPLSNPKPAYPVLARQRGQEGLVVLLVEVDERGVPVSVNIAQNSGYSILDQAAVQGIRQWRFHPARAAGVPASGRIVIPVEFRLRDAP